MVVAISLCSLMLLPSRPISGNLFHQRVPFLPNKLTTTTRTSLISASKRDSHGHHNNGKLVDASMIVLRMRIHEMEMEEEMKKKNGDASSSGWMGWERRCFENYGSDICEAVGLLQILLMETRPCLALGMLVLVLLSISMSASLAVFHLVELAKGITASGIHV